MTIRATQQYQYKGHFDAESTATYVVQEHRYDDQRRAAKGRNTTGIFLPPKKHLRTVKLCCCKLFSLQVAYPANEKTPHGGVVPGCKESRHLWSSRGTGGVQIGDHHDKNNSLQESTYVVQEPVLSWVDGEIALRSLRER